ncbi:MAG: hypothetical protein LUF84_06810, partial [Clostridiales bacterium]|nr:hypothetical protein [Clostridiales bacterium]
MSFQLKTSIRCILMTAALLCCAGCGRVAVDDLAGYESSSSVVAESTSLLYTSPSPRDEGDGRVGGGA